MRTEGGWLRDPVDPDCSRKSLETAETIPFVYINIKLLRDDGNAFVYLEWHEPVPV